MPESSQRDDITVPAGQATVASATTPAILLTEKPGDRIGHYTLVEQLGEGGCGVVYVAEQREPVRRQVAFKIIKLGMDTRQFVARFEAERQALALMEHPHIAQVLDAGATDTGRPYFVMELVRGVPVNEFCDQNQLPVRERLELFVKVCHAIQHAHQKGVIHRDVKPSNILVARHDGAPVPKVIDFGIAKALDEPLTEMTLVTRVGQFMGTPAYMSPEQAAGSKDIDTRTDIYSLGVVLYELLTGRTPFDPDELHNANLEEISRTIRERDTKRPSTLLMTLPRADLEKAAHLRRTEPAKLPAMLKGDLDWVVMKALEKDPARRYASVNGLAADVQRYLNHEPVVARPPSTWYTLDRLAQRHKAVVAGVGAVAVAVLIGLGVSTYLFFREKAARARADAAAIKSQQVAEFLKQMLAAAGPSKAQGRDATMLRDILDQTAARLGHELKDQPAVEAELRRTLVYAYEDLDEFERAVAMHREALRLRRQVFGAEHLLVAESLYDLSDSLDYYNDPAGAETALLEARAIRQRILGPRHPVMAETLNQLSWVQGRLGKLAESEQSARTAVEILRAAPIEEQNELGFALTALATTLQKMARFAEAADLHREQLDWVRRHRGEMDPGVLASLNNLSFTLVALGELDEAERIGLEALALGDKIHRGKLHRTSDSQIKALALVNEFRGELPEAEARLIEAVRAADELFGPTHGFTADARAQLVRVQVRRGRLDEAEATYRAAAAATGPMGENSLLIAGSLLALARGDLETAERRARTEVQNERAAGSGPRQTARALHMLARVLIAKDSPGDAEPLLREALALWRPENTGTPEMAEFRSRLAEALLAQPPDAARAAEAAILLREVSAARSRYLKSP